MYECVRAQSWHRVPSVTWATATLTTLRLFNSSQTEAINPPKGKALFYWWISLVQNKRRAQLCPRRDPIWSCPGFVDTLKLAQYCARRCLIVELHRKLSQKQQLFASKNDPATAG